MKRKETDISELLEKEPERYGKKRLPEIREIPKHLAKKMKYDELYKLPSLEEMNQLKEAETMYHSSLFRFQIDELLSEVKLKVKYQPKIQSWLDSLKAALKSLPSTDIYQIDDLSWLDTDIKVPILQLPKSKKGFFQFLPPLEIHEIGSYSLNTMCMRESVIDLAIKIPKEFFQKKMDFLNHLYHRKRALYLTYLAKSLRDNELIESMEFSYQNNYHLKPCLVLQPKGQLSKHFKIRLLPYPEPDTFKLNRFIPVRNNVRYSWFFGADSEDAEIPTPIYNSSILADLLLPDLTEFLKEKMSSQSIKDAIVLLKVWSIQRGFYEGSGLTGFVINMLTAYLLIKKKINALMSSYQIFRNFLLMLKNEKWNEEGVSLCQKNGDTNVSIEEFDRVFDVVFIEPSGFLNICHFMRKEIFAIIQHEASLSLKVLDNAASESFILLFINKIPFCRKFEYLVHFSKPKKFITYSKTLNIQKSVLDHGGDAIVPVAVKLCDLLKKGLGDRVSFISMEVSSISNWDVRKKPPDPNILKRVTIGLLLNQDRLFDNLEKGPVANDPSAKDFIGFWGNKSEIRRFKDGSIHEAILWPAETIQEKRSILPQIVTYILQKHANVQPSDVHYTGKELDDLLVLPKELFPKTSAPYGTGEELFFAFQQSYNTLTKNLRSLDGLPLTVTAVQGTSPAFRFTEVFPPVARLYPFGRRVSTENENILFVKDNFARCPSWVLALTVVVHLEGSGKWPDDIEALKRIKAALHIKISELLKSQFKLNSKASPTFVDVLMDGYVFRIVVAARKEITLLKQFATPEGMIKIQENRKSRELEISTDVLPKLNGVIHGLHQQHNIYGTACRLAKRWISCQLLYDYINEVVIELLMAYIFISPEPFTCPNSPQIAFQRFLALLSSFDWDSAPLIVNFNNQLTNTEIAEIHSNFTTQRANLPPMVVVIPLDRNGTMWTKDTPTNPIMKRLMKLALTSLETLEKQLYLSLVSDFKQIFRPPLTPYNAIIHLNVCYLPKYCYNIDRNIGTQLRPYKQYLRKYDEKIPIVNFDPVQFYLNDLREVYEDYALFFYDTYGGEFIAVLWKPDAFASRQFKVSHINGRMISGRNADGSANIVPNVEAILADFSILGGGLVKHVEVTEANVC